ncbi:unnamed protein product [Sphenostylis stenocarpa]|uniref:Uncharacterized protein n=1 Tax=Sphenostylis stenocarpa TaxID=92480 RepID=A0AA86SN48_9FABA|nr:unnamed protein product [Sphenostylis stenocarpa]
MGSTYSSDLTRVEVSKSPSWKDQSVVYSTSDSRTCTFHVSVGVNRASVSLRDYTLDREGTRVDIRVSDVETNKEGRKGVGTIDLTYGGSALEVLKDAGQFCIGYGVPQVRCSFLIATKHDTAAHGGSLFVTHVFGTPEQRLCLAVVQVWYDAAKGSFMCNITGPSLHASTADLMVTMKKAYGDVVDSPSSTAPNTRIIHNSGGFYGPLNGSMISDSMINFFNVYLKQ